MAGRALAGHNHVGFGTTQLDRKYLQRVFTASRVSHTIPIFLILASQLERVLPPFAIMLSLPLSLVGVCVALPLTNDTLNITLNIMSMIGIIMLLGC